MKKLFLSLIVTALGALGCLAQTNLVATLSHSSNIQEFYGASALSEAYTAAENGDVITLVSATSVTGVMSARYTVAGDFATDRRTVQVFVDAEGLKARILHHPFIIIIR